MKESGPRAADDRDAVSPPGLRPPSQHREHRPSTRHGWVPQCAYCGTPKTNGRRESRRIRCNHKIKVRSVELHLVRLHALRQREERAQVRLQHRRLLNHFQ